MKIAIMQPYFMPYIGYFQLMKAVDKYVIYDDVNYIKGGWINRNHILIDGKSKLFTISLSHASQNKLINEIYIVDDFIKLKKTIRLNYAKAPFYKEVVNLLDQIFAFPDKLLSNFIFNSFKMVFEYIETGVDCILSSTLKKDNTLRGQDKVLAICNELGADTYINAIGGVGLYNKYEFQSKNIEIKFLKTNKMTYNQFGNKFVSDLSMIDVLMFNSKEDVVKILDKYVFV